MDLLNGRLKLRHLVLFIAITDHGGILKAAEHLHMTQPAATRGLQELEAILGVRLFERGPRGVTPTLYGEAFGDHARAVLAEVRQAAKHISELADGEVGTVTVGALLAGSNVLLPKAVMRLKADHPGVTVVVREATQDVLLANLLSGLIDVMIGRLVTDAGGRIRRRTLYREPVALVTRVGHPAHKLLNPQLADLVGFPWIVPVEETSLRHELEQVFLAEGLPLPADRVECTSILTMHALLLETDMVAVLPLLVARADSDLAILPTPLESISRTVGITLPGDRVATPATKLLLRHLDAVAAEIRASLEHP